MATCRTHSSRTSQRAGSTTTGSRPPSRAPFPRGSSSTPQAPRTRGSGSSASGRAKPPGTAFASTASASRPRRSVRCDPRCECCGLHTSSGACRRRRGDGVDTPRGGNSEHIRLPSPGDRLGSTAGYHTTQEVNDAQEQHIRSARAPHKHTHPSEDCLRRRLGARRGGARDSRLRVTGSRVRGLRQEPDQEPGRGERRGDHGRGCLRGGPRLDERGGPVRRGLLRLPERLVLRPVQGLAEEGEELLLRRDDDRGGLGEGDDRQADDQAPGRRGRTQGDAQRVARQLRDPGDDAGAGAVHRRDRQRAGDDPPRPRHDHLRPGHGLAEQERHRASRRQGGLDRRDVQRAAANYKLAGADDLSLVLA